MTDTEMIPEVPIVETPQVEEPKKENVFTGAVGAFIGAAIGGAAIVLLSQMGFVASISGFVLAVCTLKGYELLGGKRSAVGIVLSIILMLLTPYVADRISWALVIMEEFDVGFADAFAAVHNVIAMAEMTGDYFKELAMLYGFTALGAFGTLRDTIKKK